MTLPPPALLRLAAARSGKPPGLHAHVTGQAASQPLGAVAAKERSRIGTSPGATLAETTLSQAARDASMPRGVVG